MSLFLLGTPAEEGKDQDSKPEPSSDTPISKSIAPPFQDSPPQTYKEEGVATTPEAAYSGDKAPAPGSYHFTDNLEEKKTSSTF